MGSGVGQGRHTRIGTGGLPHHGPWGSVCVLGHDNRDGLGWLPLSMPSRHPTVSRLRRLSVAVLEAHRGQGGTTRMNPSQDGSFGSPSPSSPPAKAPPRHQRMSRLRRLAVDCRGLLGDGRHDTNQGGRGLHPRLPVRSPRTFSLPRTWKAARGCLGLDATGRGDRTQRSPGCPRGAVLLLVEPERDTPAPPVFPLVSL